MTCSYNIISAHRPCANSQRYSEKSSGCPSTCQLDVTDECNIPVGEGCECIAGIVLLSKSHISIDTAKFQLLESVLVHFREGMGKLF